MCRSTVSAATAAAGFFLFFLYCLRCSYGTAVNAAAPTLSHVFSLRRHTATSCRTTPGECAWIPGSPLRGRRWSSATLAEVKKKKKDNIQGWLMPTFPVVNDCYSNYSYVYSRLKLDAIWIIYSSFCGFLNAHFHVLFWRLCMCPKCCRFNCPVSYIYVKIRRLFTRSIHSRDATPVKIWITGDVSSETGHRCHLCPVLVYGIIPHIV